MKKFFILPLALCCIATTSAQSNNAPMANAVLISQTKNGNTVTSRYVVRHDTGRSANFDIHYTISRAQIVPTYSDNSRQINELKEFMGESKDSTMHISAIHIVGYASPDGNLVHNDSLASHRAQALCQYAINTYHPDQKIDTGYKTFSWKECVNAVANSTIPQKEEVLAILNSNHTECEKEAHLRKLPEAWKYLTNNLLPTMRYADISFDYGVDEVITRTTIVKQPTPPATATTTSTTPATKPEVVVVDEEMGIIIATPKEDHDTKRNERKARKADKKNSKGGSEVRYW